MEDKKNSKLYIVTNGSDKMEDKKNITGRDNYWRRRIVCKRGIIIGVARIKNLVNV